LKVSFLSFSAFYQSISAFRGLKGGNPGQDSVTADKSSKDVFSERSVDHRWLKVNKLCLTLCWRDFFEKLKFFNKMKTDVYSIKNHY
jgi:hypothetical protein